MTSGSWLLRTQYLGEAAIKWMPDVDALKPGCSADVGQTAARLEAIS